MDAVRKQARGEMNSSRWDKPHRHSCLALLTAAFCRSLFMQTLQAGGLHHRMRKLLWGPLVAVELTINAAVRTENYRPQIV